MINTLTLSAALQAIGIAQVFAGDPFTAGGMVNLGATEGDVTVDIATEENVLTAPEYTGGVAHQVHIMAGEITGTIPLIMGDPAIWAKIMPTGILGMGWSSQQPVVPTSIGIVPIDEIGVGMAYNGTAWTGGREPKNAIWIWRAILQPGPMTYHFGDGGKSIMPVRLRGMFDAARPEGHKVFTIGNPVTAGITTFRL